MDGSTAIEPGTVLAEKYAVRHELGRGGMATIYEAVHVEIGKRVAIKLLAGHLTRSPAVVERFLREARAVAAIRSPYICDVFDSGKTADGVPFLVLELLEGESLYDRMVVDRQMSVELTLVVVLQVCRGLARAHEAGIVHRDLKPENIFLSFDSEGHLTVKILDFGLAKFYEEPPEELAEPHGADRGETAAPTGAQRRRRRLTQDGAVFGTPTYMSPEQVRGQGSADPRSDLWALACITYECLTGTTVWSTDEGVAMTFVRIASSPLPDPTELRPDLPASFSTWFRRALHRDLDKRLQDVRQWSESLLEAFGYRAPGGGFDPALLEELEQAAPELREPWATKWAQRATRPPSPTGLGAAPGTDGTAARTPRAPRAQPPNDRRNARGLKGVPLVLGAAIIAAATTVFVWHRRPATSAGPVQRWLGAVASSAAVRPPSTRSDRHLLERHPWLEQVATAQAKIAAGDYEQALDLLRQAFGQSRHGIARNLIEQLQVAMLARSKSAPCEVTGLARPRRYDLLGGANKAVAASPPAVVWGPEGVVVTWADRRDGRSRAHAVLLDETLGNRGLPIEVTPEATSASTPTLLPTKERLAAIYWDGAGSSAGVYARWLTTNAAIASAPISLTANQPGRYVATAQPSPDGGFWVAWAGGPDRNSVDLYYRRLGPSLEPATAAVRATDYVARRIARGQVRDIALEVLGDELHFAYAFVRDPLAQVRYQVVPRSSPPPGLSAPDGGKSSEDRTLGAEQILSPLRQRAHEPTLSCTGRGCFVAWHAAPPNGAGIAFLDQQGAVRWHKPLAPRGGHPRIGHAPTGETLLAWSEGGRLTVAALGLDGVGPASKIARVVGEQPACSVAAGAKRGEWYLAWLDFEGGHLEPYVARIVCP